MHYHQSLAFVPMTKWDVKAQADPENFFNLKTDEDSVWINTACPEPSWTVFIVYARRKAV